MPVRADDPLVKVTMNFYETDIIWFKHEYGHGWTERLRQLVHHEVTKRQEFRQTKRTLGDLSDQS